MEKRARGRQKLKMCDWMKKRINVQKEKDFGDFARDRNKWSRTSHDSSTACIWYGKTNKKKLRHV